VIFISPYFIPNEIAISHLRTLAARGVRVRILTNSLASTDAPVVHAAYARTRESLLAAGVELYEMRADALLRAPRTGESGASLHAKAVVVDREHALIGSMNLDPRSRLHNTEVALLVESSELARGIGEFFDEAVKPTRAFRLALAHPDDRGRIVWLSDESGRERRYDAEPLAGWWRRLLTNVVAPLIPKDLL
jgi:putative cardiolipin synthase